MILRAFCVVFGVALILGAVWMSAFFMDAYPMGHWANFPIFFSGLIGGLGGVGLLARGTVP